MASSWGSSWGSAWGNSWGKISVQIQESRGGGHKKEKWKYPDEGYLHHFRESPHPPETEKPWEPVIQVEKPTLHLKKKSVDEELIELLRLDAGIKDARLGIKDFKSRLIQVDKNLTELERKKRKKKLLLLLLAA